MTASYQVIPFGTNDLYNAEPDSLYAQFIAFWGQGLSPEDTSNPEAAAMYFEMLNEDYARYAEWEQSHQDMHPASWFGQLEEELPA